MIRATSRILLAWSALTAVDDSRPTAPEQTPNSWVKLTPLEGGPPSPRLGYETTFGYDPRERLVIRWSGHNQGGGGEQNAETWTFDPRTAVWTLKEPNTSPPGVCCGQQNVFDVSWNRFIRFPSFSGSHGWQWWREIYLNNSSAWSYDLATNTWRDMRPMPEPAVNPLRCASWDSNQQVIVVFGGEGNSEGTLVFDPYTNTWTHMKPAKQPEFRSGGNMAYDAARKLHILFGAQFIDDPHTWAYDLANNEWRDLQPPSQPPTNKNDAVLAYDSTNRVIVAVIKITEGEDDNAKHRLETWTFDAGANRWTKRDPPREPDPSGNRARVTAFIPDLGVTLLENRTHPPHGPPEQQVWVYRFGNDDSVEPTRLKARVQPRIVEDAVVSVLSEHEVELEWTPPPGDDIAGYHVERAVVEVWTEDQLKRLKKATGPLPRPSVGAVRRIGEFVSLTTEPLKDPRFTDRVDLTKPRQIEGTPLWERRLHAEHLDADGQPYQLAVFAYRIRAVNRLGIASGPSPYVLTIPSAPQWVFSREAGAKCDLKWTTNREKQLTGYRVYRLDGRWDKDPVSRLTPDPIAATTFTDEQAGKSTRRYHVVAVDALGQEGFPSAPVWFEREWKKFYEPFTGEWHQ